MKIYFLVFLHLVATHVKWGCEGDDEYEWSDTRKLMEGMVITHSSRSIIYVAGYFNIVGLIVHYTLFESTEEDKCVLKQENTLIFQKGCDFLNWGQ